MNESDYNQLREKSWRQKLSANEEKVLFAWFAAHPEARVDWEAELSLTKTIARLPDAPIPTNFTARVLQAVELEASADARQQTKRSFVWRSFVPRAATALIVATIGLFTLREHRVHQRAQLAQSVATVSGVASLPGPEILQDFDVINQMNHAAADKELLALMQ
jgi:hypothetical protein